MALSIRRNEKLPSGRCQTCGYEMERLVPIQVKTCRRCANTFHNKSGYDKILKTEFLIDFYCDWCLGKTFTALSLNPYICVKCTNLLGNRHRIGGREIRQKMQKSIMARGF